MYFLYMLLGCISTGPIRNNMAIGSLIVDKHAYPIYSKLRNGNYNHLTFRILSSKTFRPNELIDPEINFIFPIK